MFRKIAIALVAASVLGAPVLAQQTTTTPSDNKLSPSTSTPNATAPETSEKTVTKSTKHRVVARHHRHAKVAKYGKSRGSKMAKYGKSGKSGAKYGKYTHHTSRASGKHAYGKAMSSKPATKPSGARPGLD
jgi:Ni/Co efflux regulator RcnB